MKSESSTWGEKTQYFYHLTPDAIDQALIACGLRPSGKTLQLNSLENRVYEIEVAKASFDFLGPHSQHSVVVKFYRPGRWDKATILEEHQFLQEMKEYEISIIPPLEISGQTLFETPQGLYYAIFPKVLGRLKDELNQDEAAQIGRLIGRIHNIGEMKNFNNRIRMSTQGWTIDHLAEIEKHEFIPLDLKSYYVSLVKNIHQLITPYFNVKVQQRIHGDFHRGNILWTSSGAWVTDFDDAVMGPREQDLWLLFPGRDEWSSSMQKKFLEGYHQMSRTHAYPSAFLTEALRSMRLIHFNGWIAKRWEDPIFKHTFSEFSSVNYWQQQVLDLKMQIAMLQDSVTDSH
jgi:Ser/Thr protein kinase RdoA (MazF antagonist)